MNRAGIFSGCRKVCSRPHGTFFRAMLRCLPIMLALSCILVIPAASAWTVQDMTVEPAGGTVAPKDLVTVSYTVRFDPALEATGRTFDATHTLEMATMLAGATWSATLVNIGQNRDPITTPLGAKTGLQYRIDGGTLSYGDAQLTLIVTIRGTAPDLQDQDTTIASIRELDADGGEVPGVGETVTYHIAIPITAATAATAPKTVAAATLPAGTTATRETALAPQGTGTPVGAIVRQTYSPGPDPILIIALLVVAGIAACRAGKMKGP